MPIGLTDLTIRMRNKKLHPADELCYWMIERFSDTPDIFSERVKLFKEVKEKLHELCDTAYLLGYEQGYEDEHGESRKPLGR